MSRMSEYRAVLYGAEMRITCSSGEAKSIPMDVIASSITLRNILSSSSASELVLQFPERLLETWLQCATTEQQAIHARDIPTMVSYLEVRYQASF